MDAVKAIKKNSAQHDLFNRLHSINADAAFVQKVGQDWYEGRFPVVPNLRCGAWYCDPTSSSSQYAYFKSTDGHTNNWSFNLRRANVGLAKYAEDHGGIILVDSTRRGKRMPDALSKTVPIWCAVINLALFMRGLKGFDTSLYLPPNVVSPSEKAQIEALLPSWAKSLVSSNIALPDLKKPLRPFFIHPATSSPPNIPPDATFTPVICLSASRWIGPESLDDIPSFTRLPPTENIDATTVGFEYVQGAGDDHESWGRGLTAELFHAHKERLLRAEREEVPGVVDGILLEQSTSQLSIKPARREAATQDQVVGFPSSTSRLGLALGPVVQEVLPWQLSSEIETIWVVPLDKPIQHPAGHILQINADNMVFACPSARDAGKEFSKALESLVAHVRGLDTGRAIVLKPGDQRHLNQALSAIAATSTAESFLTSVSQVELPPLAPMAEHRKTIIPLALALALAAPELSTSDKLGTERTISKADIAETLHSLVGLWPDGNPPRAALKRVNEYLMSPSYRSPP